MRDEVAGGDRVGADPSSSTSSSVASMVSLTGQRRSPTPAPASTMPYRPAAGSDSIRACTGAGRASIGTAAAASIRPPPASPAAMPASSQTRSMATPGEPATPFAARWRSGAATTDTVADEATRATARRPTQRHTPPRPVPPTATTLGTHGQGGGEPVTGRRPGHGSPPARPRRSRGRRAGPRPPGRDRAPRGGRRCVAAMTGPTPGSASRSDGGSSVHGHPAVGASAGGASAVADPAPAAALAVPVGPAVDGTDRLARRRRRAPPG